MSSAEKINVVLASDDESELLKEKLRQVQNIVRFSRESMALDDTIRFDRPEKRIEIHIHLSEVELRRIGFAEEPKNFGVVILL